MTTIESVSLILLAIMLLPSICRSIHYPGLLYSLYLILGVSLGNYLDISSLFALQEIGKIGFILLLFLIGLEIEVPSSKILRSSSLFCACWILIQNFLGIFISWVTGWGIGFGFVAAAGINGCSLGIIYNLLKPINKLDDEIKNKIFVHLTLIEIASLVLLVGSETIFTYGLTEKVYFQISSIFCFIIIVKLISKPIFKYVSYLAENDGKWKIHQLILVILTISIIGERLGLSAPKTAFFLGLFMTAVTKNGMKIEDSLKPISERILIPLFFVGLGTKINFYSFDILLLPISISIVATIFLIRFFIFKLLSQLTISNRYFFIYCPNITMVAVASEVLAHHGYDKTQIELTLFIGLIMTVMSVLFFPTKIEDRQVESTIKSVSL